MSDVLEVQELTKTFMPRWSTGSEVHAVARVSFTLRRGEMLGLVGESGCGKSTLSRLILSLLEPSNGSVRINGVDFTHASSRQKRTMRRQIQIVFQDALSSLNPRMTVGTNIVEPLRLQNIGNASTRAAEAVRLLQLVGLRADQAERYPHEFSGGQCQRIAIARALVLKPEVIVFDEAVSALDVSVRAQILQLILDLQKQFNLSCIFISHDLAVVRRVTDRVAVMYEGKIVESGPTDEVCDRPQHPYTEALLRAIPIPDPRRMRVEDLGLLEGEVGGLEESEGCPFAPRCIHRFARCNQAPPDLLERVQGHQVACYRSPEG